MTEWTDTTDLPSKPETLYGLLNFLNSKQTAQMKLRFWSLGSASFPLEDDN